MTKPAILLLLAAFLGLSWAQAQPSTVTTTAGDVSVGSFGRALSDLSFRSNISDSFTFSALFDSSQLISLSQPMPQATKSPSHSLTIAPPRTLILSGGPFNILDFGGGGTFNVSNITSRGSNNLRDSTTLAGSFNFTQLGMFNGSILSANVSLLEAATITVTGTATASGRFAGSSGLAVNGSGTLNLTNTTNAISTLAIGSATVAISSASAIGTANLNFTNGTLSTTQTGTLNVGGSVFLGSTGTFHVPDAGATTAVGVPLGPGALAKTGAGTLTLLGVHGGAFQINAGTLAINPFSNQAVTGLISGTGTLAKNGGNTLTLSGDLSLFTGSIQANAGTLTLSRSINASMSNAISGAGTLAKAGTNTLTLTGNLSGHTGPTQLTDGALIVSPTTDTVWNTSAISGSRNFTKAGSSNLTLTGNLGGFTGNIQINGGSLILSSSANRSVASAISGPGNFVKQGSGTLTLTGGNSFAGWTRVQEGTLVLGADSAISDKVELGSSSGSSATLDLTSKSSFALATLQGRGEVNLGAGKDLSLPGLVAPGFSPGSLAIDGNVVFADTTDLLMEVAGNGGLGGTDLDFLSATGTIFWDGDLSIESFGGYDLSQPGSYDLFQAVLFDGALDSVSIGGFFLMQSGDLWVGQQTDTEYEFDASNGVLTVVPEPSAAGLVGLALVALLGQRRRAGRRGFLG